MSTAAIHGWHEANQKYLMAAVEVVREKLELYKGNGNKRAGGDPSVHAKSLVTEQKLKKIVEKLPFPAALDVITDIFDLSPFERNVLLMCAGMELDSTFSTQWASVGGDSRGACPTFGLALAALPEAHWSAITPGAPLRYWRLIHVMSGDLITKSPLRIDEGILHYLAGMPLTDEQLSGMVEPLVVLEELVPSHQNIADRLMNVLSGIENNMSLPVIQLCGDESSSKRDIAGTACFHLGLKLFSMSASGLPGNPSEFDVQIRLWEREAALNGSALFLDCDGTDTTDDARMKIIEKLCERMRGIIILNSREKRYKLQRPTIIFEVSKPTAMEQDALWKTSLGINVEQFNDRIEMIVSQFNLSPPAIRSASSEAQSCLAKSSSDQQLPSNDPGSILWQLCRMHTRPQLAGLAQKIEPRETWDDIVLPEQQKQILREVSLHVRNRLKVYEKWGFAHKSSRGLGISTLFVGESGTGKTMASEVLAKELQLDLYRIDLSQVVNKYIGETEKNLKRLFDAAEDGGAILLFDEADALFGKRSDVKDSHDRYANIEVSYLLQRMEAYRGLAILTTNMKKALDTAFLRRIRFIVQFPFPDAAQRAEIWRRIFPPDTPVEDLDIGKLARLNIAGGNIRNIALNAAFLSADAGEPVRMEHVLRATRSEYMKIEKPLSTSEMGEW